mmetsp:Transcript_50258/g.109245  ORF Transcript_50258/g.109245 Transcript_50258/m.109245 type:complete len:267 (+) Transcript_50258:306-1106(+)
MSILYAVSPPLSPALSRVDFEKHVSSGSECPCDLKAQLGFDRGEEGLARALWRYETKSIVLVFQSSWCTRVCEKGDHRLTLQQLLHDATHRHEHRFFRLALVQHRHRPQQPHQLVSCCRELCVSVAVVRSASALCRYRTHHVFVKSVERSQRFTRHLYYAYEGALGVFHRHSKVGRRAPGRRQLATTRIVGGFLGFRSLQDQLITREIRVLSHGPLVHVVPSHRQRSELQGRRSVGGRRCKQVLLDNIHLCFVGVTCSSGDGGHFV